MQIHSRLTSIIHTNTCATHAKSILIALVFFLIVFSPYVFLQTYIGAASPLSSESGGDKNVSLRNGKLFIFGTFGGRITKSSFESYERKEFQLSICWMQLQRKIVDIAEKVSLVDIELDS